MSDTEPTPSLINPNSMNTRSATVAGARRVYRRYWAGSVPSLGGNLEPPNLLNLQLSATSRRRLFLAQNLSPGSSIFSPTKSAESARNFFRSCCVTRSVAGG